MMFDDNVLLELNENALVATELTIIDLNSITHEIVSGTEPEEPFVWIANALIYSDEWSISDAVLYEKFEVFAKEQRNKILAENVIVFDRGAACEAIDSAVLAIYKRPTSLAEEYKGREADALVYKAANYTGVVPARVYGFATPAQLTAQEATDRILLQATQYRDALGQLSDLRMQTYAVMNASSDVDSKSIADNTLAVIASIAAALT